MTTPDGPAVHPLFRSDAAARAAAPGSAHDGARPDDDAERFAARVTRLAAALLGAPMVSLAVADGDGLYLKSCVGFPPARTPRPGSPFLCPLSRHVFTSGAPLAVADVAAHPLGAGQAGLAALGIRAYLGHPLRTDAGATLGMLSVFAHEPREWSHDQAALLGDLAALAVEESELHAAARAATAAEQARRAMLRESEERYRLLFDANPRPTWVYDVDTLRFLAVNAAAVERYGWTREEFLAMSILDVRPPEDSARVAQQVAEKGNEAGLAGEWRHVTRDGRQLHVLILSHAVPFGPRRARLVMVDDVTERRRLEERLRDAQKMEAVGRLAGGMAHDFNNVLTAVKGYSQITLRALDSLAARGPAASSGNSAPLALTPEALARLRADVGEINAAAVRAASLTAQLLAFSRRQVLQPVVLDLNASAAAMESMARRLIGERIDIRLALTARPGHVRADPSQLEQVLLNLVLNARDAMPGGGRLTIETANVAHGDREVRLASLAAGAYVALTVRDTGDGMDEATLARAFEPFFTTKDVGKGTGLGLSTVYGIAKQSAGDVAIESAPGQGTAVSVYLPAAEEPPATGETPRGPARARLAPRREGAPERVATVLVVEDEPGVRQLARAVLERLGHRVVPAADGAEALRLLAVLAADGIVPDLLVTDVVMPEMGGPELAAEVARRHPGVAVLYMSGYSEHAVEQQGELGAGTAFLEKPFTLEQFAAHVRELLEPAG